MHYLNPLSFLVMPYEVHTFHGIEGINCFLFLFATRLAINSIIKVMEAIPSGSCYVACCAV